MCVFWGCGVPNHKFRACFYSSHSLCKCRIKTCISCFLQSKPNLHQVDHLLSLNSYLLISCPIVVKQEIVRWQEMEGGWSFPDAGLYLTLTSSAQPCGLPRHCIPPATCPLGEWASGRSAWTPVCLCTSASPGTGIAAPSDIHLGAGESGNNQGVKRKQALFTLLNSSGQVPPTWSSHQSRAILKESLAYK